MRHSLGLLIVVFSCGCGSPKAASSSAVAAPGPAVDATGIPEGRMLTLDASGLRIAGAFAGASAGLRVSFGFPHAELPPLGYPQRGGGVVPIDCEAMHADAEEASPEREQCERMFAKGRGQAQAWYARFRREWEIGPSGVSVIDGARRVPVPGAKLRFVPRGGDALVDVTFPLSALPLAAEAPVREALFHAAPVEGYVPPTDEQFALQLLEPAASLGRTATLRAEALEHWGRDMFEGVPSVGYRLGDENHWVVASRSPYGDEYVVATKPVFEHKFDHDAVRVGVLFTGTPQLVTIVDGKIVDGAGLGSAQILGAHRYGEVSLVVAFGEYPDELGGVHADAVAYLVLAKGGLNALQLPIPVPSWLSVWANPAADLSTIELEGVGRGFDGEPRSIKLRYALDPASMEYELSAEGLE